MAPEDAAINMHLVHNHEAKVAEQTDPEGMVRKNPLVQHIGIRDHDARTLPNLLAAIRRRVAIVDLSSEVHLQDLRVPANDGLLVAREGLRGKKQEGARFGVLLEGLQNGKQVAKRLSRGARRGYDAMLPLAESLVGLRLVSVELLDSLRAKALLQGRRKALR